MPHNGRIWYSVAIWLLFTGTALSLLWVDKVSEIPLYPGSTYTEAYSLDFRDRNMNWRREAGDPVGMRFDTVNHIHGKAPLIIEYDGPVRTRRPFKFSMNQLIKLPGNEADSLTVTISANNRNLNIAGLVVIMLDMNESVKASDTIFFDKNGVWTDFSGTFDLQNADLLHLNVFAEGFTDQESSLGLDRIIMWLNGKLLDEFPHSHISLPCKLNAGRSIPLSFDDDSLWENTGALRGKVISFGETIHGSLTVHQSVVQAIRNMVEKHDCRLVLMELPIERMMAYDAYIQGDKYVDIDSLVHDDGSAGGLMSSKPLIEFYRWLRDFNAGREDKVRLMGIDLFLWPQFNRLYLFDYLFAAARGTDSQVMDSLCGLMIRKENWREISDYLKRNKNEISAKIGSNYYTVLEHISDLACRWDDSNTNLYSARDSVMFANASLLIDMFCPGNNTAAVYSHFGHANYGSVSGFEPTRASFGRYMREFYGENYTSIGVLCGRGGYFTNDVYNRMYTVTNMESPVPGSLESLCLEVEADYFYLPRKEVPEGIMYMREVGNAMRMNQFSLISPAVRMDGAVFIRHNEAIRGAGFSDTPRADPGYIFKSKAAKNRKAFESYMEAR